MFNFSSTAFESAVSNQISSTGSSFTKGMPIGGLEHDFVAQPAKDRNVIFELKNWKPTEDNITRAVDQVRFLRQTPGSSESYVVLPKKPSFKLPTGVITIEDIPDILKITPSMKPIFPLRDEVAQISGQPIFAAMPFSGEYDDVYFVAMREAAKQAGGAMRRVDQEPYEGDIVEKIHAMIDTAVVIIADLSESKPNVLYETGYARGRGLPVVPICSTNLSTLPFDVRNWNVIEYKRGGTFHLIPKLTERLRSLLKAT